MSLAERGTGRWHTLRIWKHNKTLYMLSPVVANLVLSCSKCMRRLVSVDYMSGERYISYGIAQSKSWLIGRTTTKIIFTFKLVLSFVENSRVALVEVVTQKNVTLGSLRNATATPRTTSIKKWVCILPTYLAVPESHLLCLSLSKLSRNWI